MENGLVLGAELGAELGDSLGRADGLVLGLSDAGIHLLMHSGGTTWQTWFSNSGLQPSKKIGELSQTRPSGQCRSSMHSVQVPHRREL